MVRLIAKGLVTKMTSSDIYVHKVVILSSKYSFKRHKKWLEVDKNISSKSSLLNDKLNRKNITWVFGTSHV